MKRTRILRVLSAMLLTLAATAGAAGGPAWEIPRGVALTSPGPAGGFQRTLEL